MGSHTTVVSVSELDDSIIPPTPEPPKQRAYSRSFLRAAVAASAQDRKNRTKLIARKKTPKSKAAVGDRPAANYAIGESVEQLSDLQMQCVLATSGYLPPPQPAGHQVEKCEIGDLPAKRPCATKGLSPEAKRRMVTASGNVPTRRKLQSLPCHDQDDDTDVQPLEGSPDKLDVSKINKNIMVASTASRRAETCAHAARPVKTTVGISNGFSDASGHSETSNVEKKQTSEDVKVGRIAGSKLARSNRLTSAKTSDISNSNNRESQEFTLFDDDLLTGIIDEIRCSTQSVKHHSYDQKLDNKWKRKNTPNSKKKSRPKSDREEKVSETPDRTLHSVSSPEDTNNQLLSPKPSQLGEVSSKSGQVAEVSSKPGQLSEASSKPDQLEVISSKSDPLAEEPVPLKEIDLDCSGFSLDGSWMDHVDLDKPKSGNTSSVDFPTKSPSLDKRYTFEGV